MVYWCIDASVSPTLRRAGWWLGRKRARETALPIVGKTNPRQTTALVTARADSREGPLTTMDSIWQSI